MAIRMKLSQDASPFRVYEAEGLAQDTLMPHISTGNALLMLQTGSLTYIEGESKHPMQAGDYRIIPANKVHSLACSTDVRFLLVLAEGSQIQKS